MSVVSMIADTIRYDIYRSPEQSLETTVALDAMEANDPRAHLLLVGCPVTVSIGSDRYGARIAKCTPSLHTIQVEDMQGERWLTFTRRKRHGHYAGYRSGSSYSLYFGIAEDHRDPHF